MDVDWDKQNELVGSQLNFTTRNRASSQTNTHTRTYTHLNNPQWAFSVYQLSIKHLPTPQHTPQHTAKPTTHPRANQSPRTVNPKCKL